MTMLNMWLIIVLSFSLAANAVLLWYLRKLLNKFIFISGNLMDLVDVVENYYKHLEHVNNMETYNGDETIAYLLRHTQSLMDVMEDYRDVYDISVPQEEEQETLGNERENTQAQAAPPEQIEVSEENVFYAGTRRRDS